MQLTKSGHAPPPVTPFMMAAAQCLHAVRGAWMPSLLFGMIAAKPTAN